MLANKFSKCCMFAVLALGFATASPDSTACETWYVQSGGTGDGTQKKNPFGSLGEAEWASTACDTIAVLPSDQPLNGGIILKEDQKLVGKGANPAKDTSTLIPPLGLTPLLPIRPVPCATAMQ